MEDAFRKAALDYHRLPRPGKTRDRADQADGHAARPRAGLFAGGRRGLRAIKADPNAAYDYTARGNLVGVISNGTAVLGLGNIGALAGKPVMEGKAVLFKKFAGIDVFDIEVDAAGPGTVLRRRRRAGTDLRRDQPGGHQGARMLRHRGGLRARMRIPVFHDDQHGTAITVAAAVRNGLLLQGKTSRTSSWSPPAPARRRWPASICWSRWGCGRTTSR